AQLHASRRNPRPADRAGRRSDGRTRGPDMAKKIIKHIDHSEMEGGLGRMLDRYRDEGTLTGDPAEDAYLAEEPAAALLGLLYDQRVRAEYAFAGPRRLHERLGHLDLKRIATMSPSKFQERFAESPAVHRFTNRMAEYTRQ